MRVVEEKIIDLINSSGSGKLSQRDNVVTVDGISVYELWGHRVFWYDGNKIVFSLCGYDTVTTKSRLNAIIGAYCDGRFYTKNYNVFFVLNGKKYSIDPSKNYVITFSDTVVTDFRED